jgi:predicted phosphodiesterase
VRIAVISDIHGNLPALEAVIADAGAVDAWWCLGDLLGYGADPNDCVARVRELGAVVLAGNHDLGAIGLEDLRRFNDHAARCLRWTAGVLEIEHREYLLDLAERPVRLERQHYTLVHASPRDPVWEYVDGPRRARANFAYFSTQYCLLGHTHVPAAYDERGETIGADGSLTADRRASYLLIDEEAKRWEWRRVAYDVDEAAARIRQAGLPEIEAARLSFGR